MTITTASNSRGPSPIDVHVGGRVRLRRRALGLSQQVLARALGLTFQQVQKYELGTNRVSASKLWEIAGRLDCAVAWFYEGLPSAADIEAEDPVDRRLREILRDDDARTLLMTYSVMPPRLRRSFVTLAAEYTVQHASDDDTAGVPAFATGNA